jgi:hypothetical protein
MNIKQTLKKVFDKSVLLVVVIVFGFIATFEYVVFPGLTAADSYLNIISALIGIFSILFIYHSIQWKDLFSFLSKEDGTVLPGETEYDYIPKEEIVKQKTIKKKPTKKKVLNSDETAKEKKVSDELHMKWKGPEKTKKK